MVRVTARPRNEMLRGTKLPGRAARGLQSRSRPAARHHQVAFGIAHRDPGNVERRTFRRPLDLGMADIDVVAIAKLGFQRLRDAFRDGVEGKRSARHSPPRQADEQGRETSGIITTRMTRCAIWPRFRRLSWEPSASVRDTRLFAVDLKGALVGTSVAGSAEAASAWTAGVEAAQPRRPRRRRERLALRRSF